MSSPSRNSFLPTGLSRSASISDTEAALELASPRRLGCLPGLARATTIASSPASMPSPLAVSTPAAVKTAVYHPDWRSPDRLAYTLLVARLLAVLIPAGAGATLTTVPGGWLPDWTLARRSCAKPCRTSPAPRRAAARFRESTGRHIRIAIEPEPGCAWTLFDPRLDGTGRRDLLVPRHLPCGRRFRVLANPGLEPHRPRAALRRHRMRQHPRGPRRALAPLPNPSISTRPAPPSTAKSSAPGPTSLPP